jgi:CobQ-like glutamine amidotransferase family enzyme
MELFPDHLNLNGDSGNITVLEKRIGWLGLGAKRTAVQPGQVPVCRPDFLLIGHGSAAAWKQVYPHLARLAPAIQDWMKQGTRVLAVSSGFAALHGLLQELPHSVERSDRISKFVSDEFEGQSVTGYLNTDLQLPMMLRHGNLLGTMLHGPLLAKNSWLADEIIESLKPEQGSTNNPKFAEVEQLANAARELAAEQAND